MPLIPTKSIYDDETNKYYNPDAGHDSTVPGENENWLAIQKGFKGVSTDITSILSEINSLKDRVTALEQADRSTK